MAWQDELIELETKLASGALSAEEYRRARDELFARSQTSSAAADPEPEQQPAPQPEAPAAPEPPAPQPSAPQPSAQQPSAPQSQQPAPTPQQQPQTQPPPQPQQPPAAQPPQPQPPAGQPTQQAGPGQQGGPFPPPFQWGQGGAEQPDSTQVIRQVENEPGERTQVVRNDPERTQAVSDPERTQTVSGVGAPGQPHHQQPPQRPAQGWTDDDAPPWANQDAAPVIAPNTTWTKQGPEAFDGGGGGKRGRLVGTVVAGVLVVALAVVAVIYFTNTGGENNQANTPTGQAPAAGGGDLPKPGTPTPPPLPEPPPQKSEPKSVAAALTKVPGQIRPGGGPIKRSDIATSTFLDKKILQAFEDAGFTGGLFKATTENGANIGVFAMTVRDADAAKQAAQAYATVQTEGGIPSRRQDSMRGVAVFGNPDSSTEDDQVRRAVYVLYQRVIIIDVSGSDKQGVQQTFQELLDKQVNFAPPTERADIP